MDISQIRPTEVRSDAEKPPSAFAPPYGRDATVLCAAHHTRMILIDNVGYVCEACETIKAESEGVVVSTEFDMEFLLLSVHDFIADLKLSGEALRHGRQLIVDLQEALHWLNSSAAESED
jgi:hypothetical protein